MEKPEENQTQSGSGLESSACYPLREIGEKFDEIAKLMCEMECYSGAQRASEAAKSFKTSADYMEAIENYFG